MEEIDVEPLSRRENPTQLRYAPTSVQLGGGVKRLMTRFMLLAQPVDIFQKEKL